jgi:histidine ammonia-lyase
VKSFEADIVEAQAIKGAIGAADNHNHFHHKHQASSLSLMVLTRKLCISYCHTLQVKSFEADVVEAQGYKGAIGAADELRGLLEGSKAVGTRKGLGAQQQAAYSSLPQVCLESDNAEVKIF